MAASAVGANPTVRAFLLELQRDMAKKQDVLMDGRDIGTVVLPDAALKVYLDADVNERARRRQAELVAKGQALTVEAVREDLRARDAQDMQRATAPLRQAEDAVFLDSTGQSPQQLAQEIVRLAQARGA
jgi:cytidylate kinase